MEQGRTRTRPKRPLLGELGEKQPNDRNINRDDTPDDDRDSRISDINRNRRIDVVPGNNRRVTSESKAPKKSTN
jgi:hypothetical protein